MSLIFNNGISCLICNQNGKKAVIPYIPGLRVRISSLYLVHIKMEAKTQTQLKIKSSAKMRSFLMDWKLALFGPTNADHA